MMLSLATANVALIGVLLPSSILAAPQGSSPMPDLLERTTGDASSETLATFYNPPSSYTGDALNLTRCFCEDMEPTPPKSKVDESIQASTWGHHFQFDYYNWHLKNLYSLSLTCKSSKQVTGYGRMLPVCWDQGLDRKDCRTFPDGNTFCYQTGSLGYWSDGQLDHYYFNEQKRGLPKRHGYMIPNMCEDFCRDKVGMSVARDAEGGFVKTWKKGDKFDQKKVESTFRTYVDTDDMCPRCK